MIEIPEAQTLAGQLESVLKDRTIIGVQAASSPHGFAFYTGDPQTYPGLLEKRPVGACRAVAGRVEMQVGENNLVFFDGVNPRFFVSGAKTPVKHQLCLRFDDGSALTCSVQMYGGMLLQPLNATGNKYDQLAREKPGPLTDGFTPAYFDSLFSGLKPELSVKAFLATEQRIPGLGNGVLQDILFYAGIHPATRLSCIHDGEKERLYRSVKTTLRKMTDGGGRDTEKDLFGQPGGYRTVLSRLTVKKPCPVCGGTITRQAYLGGNVYFCPACQPLVK